MVEAVQPPVGPHLGVAFLLAQLGAHAAARYGERIGELELGRAHSGLLLAIARTPGQSQQALAAALGAPPTRLVALLDDLEARGAVQRRRNPDDRRYHAVYLTDTGRTLMRALARVSAAHEADLTAALDQAERDQLHTLLVRIAAQQHLRAGVHPGYADQGDPTAESPPSRQARPRRTGPT